MHDTDPHRMNDLIPVDRLIFLITRIFLQINTTPKFALRIIDAPPEQPPRKRPCVDEVLREGSKRPSGLLQSVLAIEHHRTHDTGVPLLDKHLTELSEHVLREVRIRICNQHMRTALATSVPEAGIVSITIAAVS